MACRLFTPIISRAMESRFSITHAASNSRESSQSNLTLISQRLRTMEIDSSAFINPPTGHEARGVHWIRPELVCEVEFAEWTGEGILRHSSFKGLREDKDPREIVREKPLQDSDTGNKPAGAAGKKKQARSPAENRY
ncbi:MAG: hypothetical protein AB9866_28960 [Syntrophobacteraceae bacterium]